MREAIVPPGLEFFHDHLRHAPGLRSGDLLFVSGQIGLDGTMPPTLVEGAQAQIEKAFDHIATILEAAGAGFADVVEVNSFHVGSLPEQMPLMIGALAARFEAPYPSWTSVEVAGLAMPGCLVEIKVTARIPAV